MDFRNLCSKIDVDSIKAKFPQMPAMPHIKIPKSFPKLKSRKIFRSSREEVSRASVKQTKRETLPATLSVPPPQPAGFINRTPTRISTISSLMNEYSTGFGRSASDSIEQYEENTYRSANRIDDDYPSPYSMYGTRYGDGTRESPEKRVTVRGTSPKMTASSSSVKMSFGEKLQKSYKDFSGFRFKNILTKRTILRRDNIVVDYYVQRYKEDQVVEDREQKSRDQRIADNYRFNFKESRQNTGDSVTTGLSDSPTVKKSLRKEVESPQNQKIRNARKSVSEKSDDESGMETSPPKRVPKGPAPTHRVEPKRCPLRRDISQNSNPDEHTVEMHESKHAPITSSLWAIKKNQDPRESSENRDTGKKGHQERMRRLTSSVSSLEESGAESVTEKSAKGAGYTLPYQQSVDEKGPDQNNPVNAIKYNMKRFKSTMSIKHQPPKIPNGSDDEDHREHDQHNGTRSPPTQRTIKEKLTARLRRLKSGEASSVEDIAKDRNSPKKNDGVDNSPLRATFNKFQTWKKAFRNKPGYPGAGDDGSPEKRSHSSILIEKLKYIRSLKNPNTVDAMESDDGLEAEATGDAKKTNVNTMERFEKARHKTFKKMNDKMQKIFHKSQENVGKDIETEGATSTTLRNISPPPSRPQRFLKDDEHSSEDDDIEEIPTKKSEEDYSLKPKIHAVWTTNPILSESTESEDNTKEYPRVLIHQDNSDAFESTLIIAVTTAAPSQKQRITEILPERTQDTTPKELDWIPNKEIVSGFLKLTPPAERKLSLASIGKKASLTRGHKRNQSMDSNSDSNSDPWIPKSVQKEPLFAISRDFSRRASGAELDSIQESEKPWRVHTMHPKTLYKTQSIDIFGENVKYGNDGMHEPFEDFDDHLVNEPVLKIARKSNSEDESLSKESSEDPDAGDDDNSSRITKIRVGNISEERLLSNSPQFSLNEDYQEQQIGNSRESLDANFDENEEYTDDDYDYDDEGDDDRPPSVAPSPPPSFSPPPLPQRQPLMRFVRPTVSGAEAVPPLPTSKPPAPPTRPPPQIPERTESMARISKPLVKTSSLRLAYTEQVKPADVGKVNKLISRFEQPTPEQKVSTRSEFNNRDGSEDCSYYKEEEDDERDEESVQTEPEDDINNNDDEDSMTTPTNIHPTISIWNQDSLDEGAVGEIVRTTKKRVAPKPEPVRMTTDSITTAQITRSPSSRDDENNNNNNQSDKLLMVEKEDAVGEIKTAQRNAKCGENYTVKQLNIPKLTLTTDLYTQNIPQSQASSEYGSPLEYPSSLIGSTETTPTPGRKQQQELRTPGRRVRSMVRDDDQYYSFDSDDENSYYSISSVGSNRYVVEI